jgi:hypothetical protein
MDQFGVHMNFLGIKHVLAFIFALKILFQMNFYILSPDRIARTNEPKAMGFCVKNPETQG